MNLKKIILNTIIGILVLILIINWPRKHKQEKDAGINWTANIAEKILDMSEKVFFPGVLGLSEETEESNFWEIAVQK